MRRPLASFASRADYNAENANRFWSRVTRGLGCWERAGSHSSGYVMVTWMGREAKGHRIAWELTHGAIPAGLHVLHDCDNPGCVRPDHLRLGTHSDNMQDIVDHGYHTQALKTQCPQGHPYDEVNTLRSGGKRVCRTCKREKSALRPRKTAQRRHLQEVDA